MIQLNRIDRVQMFLVCKIQSYKDFLKYNSDMSRNIYVLSRRYLYMNIGAYSNVPINKE